MGPPLHRLPGAPRQGRALTLPSVLLLACPDDYLLELERRDIEATWREAHPDGETEALDPAPAAARLVQALVSPSLFASARLVVVPDGEPYFGKDAKEEDIAPLAEAVEALAWEGVTLLLAASVAGPPGGALADAIGRRGEVRWLPVPDPPKPWDQVQLTPQQRDVLVGLVRRMVPSLVEAGDVLEALLESYGFRPRELVQAAESIAASGDPTPEAVRVQAGPGEVELRHIEEVLINRDVGGAARLFGILAAGGRLLGFRGEIVEPDRQGSAVASFVARVLRQALAVRAHANQVGLGDELEPSRTARGDWYPRRFKPKLYPRLNEVACQTEGSPVAALSAWQLHRVFKVAAGYEDSALLRGLAALAEISAERDRGWLPVAALSGVILSLISDPPG